MINTIYITNPQNHYFAISVGAWKRFFNSNYLLRLGCVVHKNKQSMYEQLISAFGYHIDEIEGHEFSIFINDKCELVCCDGRYATPIEEKPEDLDEWLARYSL